MADLSLPKLFAKRDYYVIDERVKPLVDAMNATGLLETIASCQGHGRLCRAPYVYFKATVEYAAHIEHELRAYYIGGQLNELWSLEGLFNGEYQLCFALRAPRHEERARSIVSSLLNFHDFFRSRVDQDFETLSGLFRECLR